MFFLFDFGCEAAGSRERRFWASKRLCFIRFLYWNAIMARGIGGSFSQSCSRARRGSFFQCNFFRFDFGSIFGSIQVSVGKGIEKGVEHSKPTIKTWIRNIKYKPLIATYYHQNLKSQPTIKTYKQHLHSPQSKPSIKTFHQNLQSKPIITICNQHLKSKPSIET